MYNDRGFQQQTQQDVFTGVNTSYASTLFGQDNQDTQEFSLSSIQQRLGSISTAEEDTFGSSPDLMPSSQTLNMTYNREYTAEKTRIATKMSTRSKVMIASYAVVVLALILAVTLCSVSVGSSFGSALTLNQEYVGLSETVAQLADSIQKEDYEALDKRAAELGYVDVSNANQMVYTELETRPAQNFQVESNWFDSLCDWLCNVFGG